MSQFRSTFGFLRTTALLSLVLVGVSVAQEEPGNLTSEPSPAPHGKVVLPELQELIQVIREHVPSISQTDIERAAVKGVLTQFQPQIELVSSLASKDVGISLIATNQVYASNFVYLRIGAVPEDLAQQLDAVFESVSETNDVRGLVVDLRYTGGRDYGAAVKTASLFLDESRRLLDWGHGFENSGGTDRRINVPSIALINGETRGSAEALAAMFRAAGIGLLIGSNTAGQAHIFHEITLSSEDKLRVAKNSIRIGNGTTLSKEGVQPDISIVLAPEEEAAYFKDAFSKASNHRQRQPRPARSFRPNEAELVRQHSQNQRTAPQPTATESPEPPPSVIYDPALARAIDVLKGLDIVEQFSKSRNSR